MSLLLLKALHKAEELRVIKGSEKEASDVTGQGFRLNYDDVEGVFKADSPVTTNSAPTTKKEKKQIKRASKKASKLD